MIICKYHAKPQPTIRVSKWFQEDEAPVNLDFSEIACRLEDSMEATGEAWAQLLWGSLGALMQNLKGRVDIVSKRAAPGEEVRVVLLRPLTCLSADWPPLAGFDVFLYASVTLAPAIDWPAPIPPWEVFSHLEFRGTDLGIGVPRTEVAATFTKEANAILRLRDLPTYRPTV